ncbi:MAG: VWA domain-containing protein [Vicinamibacteria bacterium]|nr:VWA domain-containing protein [Vicinamibacteria bacterium]
MARRRADVFGLSFLDCICCGFGATVLIFMIISSAAQRRDDPNAPLRAEVDKVAQEVLEGERRLVVLRNTVREVDDQRAKAQGLSTRVLAAIRQSQEELATFDQSTVARREAIEKLKADLKALEEGTKRLSGGVPSQEVPGDKVRTFVGDGDRQYLTGLKVGGKRILVLVDASASMLADTIVNAIRRRHLPAEQRRQAAKWRQAVRTADWLATQMPRDSRFQIYAFDVGARPVVAGTDGVWLDAGDPKALDSAVQALKQLAPENGTSLHAAFAAAAAMTPRPDNIVLITDGLPTQGRTPPRGKTVSGRDRLRLFERAMDELPRGVPVNVILLPMEGDPMAASAFWKLAMATSGSFMTPSRDWP